MRKFLASWAIVLLALIAGTGASAHFSSWEYTWSDCWPGDAGVRIQDPIGIIFEREAHYRTGNHIEHHTAWDINGGPGVMFGGHGECENMHASHANGGLTETRYHARLWRTPHVGDVVGETVTATPHFEDITNDEDCDEPPYPFRHAVREDNADNVSGYDMGRRRLGDRLSEFSEHAAWRAANWGNTRGIRQCDLEYPSSNGWVRWIPIPNWNHG